jgi:hypothetical protein
MSRYRIVIFLYTVIPKSVVIFFNIFISVIIVAGFGDIVAKFAVVNAKISIVNTFLIYDIRSIAKDLISSVAE